MLVWASQQKSLSKKMIKKLCEAGADLDHVISEDDTTPLNLILSSNVNGEVHKMIALYNATKEGKDQNLCEQLLGRDADPTFVDKDGFTPLYFACSDGREGLVEKLINRGADANAAGCLQISLDLMYNYVAKILIKNGADVNKVGGH